MKRVSLGITKKWNEKIMSLSDKIEGGCENTPEFPFFAPTFRNSIRGKRNNRMVL